MEHVIHFFGSGMAFFVGAGGVLIGLVIFVIRRIPARKTIGTLLAVLGLILVGLSAAPLPYAVYAIAGAATLIWLVAERLGADRVRKRLPLLRIIVAGAWLVAVGNEIVYLMPPTLTKSGRPTLYVIGDSVSAGLSDADPNTWPKVLAKTHNIKVEDLSQMGAKVGSALKQAEQLPGGGNTLVLLEIGGNDLLGGTPPDRFETELDALLSRVCVDDRVTLMFELPLPPFGNEFGRIQRHLAATHGVKLIPKHVFSAVITGDKMTVDGVHLSKAGHARMAEVVWSVIQPAYGE